MKENEMLTLSEKDLPKDVKVSVTAALDKKAEDIVVLSLSKLSSFTDYFVIMHGNSSKQNSAICEHIERKLRAIGTRPISTEGKQYGSWILIDYGSFIIHIFNPESRSYYALEKLWGDAPKIVYSS